MNLILFRATKKAFQLTILTLIGSFLIANHASALTVGPAKIEYNVNPGDTVTGELVLINEESETRTYYPVFEKFTEVDGERKFWPGEEVSLSGWFDGLVQQTIEPGKQVRIPYTLRIPWNAPPGGHFAVIWWSNSPPQVGTQPVSIVTRAGIIFYVRVSGKIEEQGRIKEFKPIQTGSFYEYLPQEYILTFENEGNVHLKPQGTVEIKNIFGQISKELAINNSGVNVLPKSGKNLFITNPDNNLPFAIGPYTLKANIIFGESKLVASSESITIFVFPWKEVLKFGGLGLVGIYILFFGIRRYNRWIIRRYKK